MNANIAFVKITIIKMKSLIKSTVAIFLLISMVGVCGNLFAQDKEIAVIEKLTSKDKRRVAKADKWLTKGYDILKEAKVYDDKAASLKEAKGKIKMGKINKLDKKSDGIKIKAASYLQDGYKKKAKVFGSIIKDSRKTNPQLASRLKEVEFNSDKKIKKSKKLYRKADDMASKSKAVEYFELGHKNYVEAIDILYDGLSVIYNIESVFETDNSITEENTTSENETMTTDNEADLSGSVTGNANVSSVAAGGVAAVATTAAVVAAGNNTQEDEKELIAVQSDRVAVAVSEQALPAITIASEETTEQKSDINVFFTIQFIADKSPVTPEVLKTKYSGDKEIVEMSAGGWYRYSAGKFTNLNEAKAVMKAEGIKGFIVAYSSGERITVTEAVELLK